MVRLEFRLCVCMTKEQGKETLQMSCVIKYIYVDAFMILEYI